MSTDQPTARTQATQISPSPETVTNSWRAELVLWLGLGVITFLAYANSFQTGLVLDSKVIILSDQRIRAWSPENLQLIFTKNYWWPFTNSDLYRPLTTLSYLINYTAFGNGPQVASYHFVNFLLHWTNAWFVFLLLRRLAQSPQLACLAAVFFAVHPIGVESVTNVVGRADLFTTLSILAGGWCHIRSTESLGQRRILWLAGLALATMLGVFAKENGVMILPFLVLYDWLWRWPKLKDSRLRMRLLTATWEFGLKGYVALLPALTAFFIVRHNLADALTVAGQFFVDNPIAYAGWFQGFMTAMLVIGRYLGLLIFPHTLSSDYSYDQIPLYGTDAAWWQDLFAWLSLCIVALLIWSAFRRRKTHPLYAWGVLFFFGMLLPTSNIIIPIGSIMAERFLYLPMVGFSVLAALAIRELALALSQWTIDGHQVFGRYAKIGVPLAVFAALMLRTHVRNADWHDELSLWKSAVEAAPNSFKTHKGYSGALIEAGQNEAALDAGIASAEIGLSILDKTPLPPERREYSLYYALGIYYRQKGELLESRGLTGEAQKYFEKAVEQGLRATSAAAWINNVRRQKILSRSGSSAMPADEDARLYIPVVYSYIKLKNWVKVREFSALLQQFAPSDANGYYLAAIGDANTANYELSVIENLAALLLKPTDPELHRNLGNNLLASYVGLGVSPPPVVITAASIDLKTNNPIVRRHLNEACALVAKKLQDAGLRREAEAFLRENIKMGSAPTEMQIKTIPLPAK